MAGASGMGNSLLITRRARLLRSTRRSLARLAGAQAWQSGAFLHAHPPGTQQVSLDDVQRAARPRSSPRSQSEDRLQRADHSGHGAITPAWSAGGQRLWIQRPLEEAATGRGPRIDSASPVARQRRTPPYTRGTPVSHRRAFGQQELRLRSVGASITTSWPVKRLTAFAHSPPPCCRLITREGKAAPRRSAALSTLGLPTSDPRWSNCRCRLLGST